MRNMNRIRIKVKIRIRIRIKVKIWIRIRIIVFQIRNTGVDGGTLGISVLTFSEDQLCAL